LDIPASEGFFDLFHWAKAIMSREQLTELQRRCIEVVDRLGGVATARQVADVIGVRGERVLDALKAMSDMGFVVKSVKSKANGSRYVFSAIKSVLEVGKENAAKTRTIVNASHGGKYDGADLHPIPGLPQSRLVAFSLPSRVGNRRYHKDGRVEVIE
jgi:hypothetical protein